MEREKLIFILIITVIVLVLYCFIYIKKKEGFQNETSNCPNILIQDGNTIYLKNSNLAEIPGVNPIKFDNLEDYIEFYNWQKSQNINCPVLFLQKSYNAQNEKIYKIRPNFFDLQGGLNESLPDDNQSQYPTTLLIDSNRNNPPYNENSYPSYDPDNQYIGTKNPLDYIQSNPNEPSANAMDGNWGGPTLSRQQVKAKKFSGDEVYVPKKTKNKNKN